MPPSAMTGTPALAPRLRRLEDGGELRHADAGDDAGGADRARADADLDRVGAGVDQRLRALARRDVAGDDRHFVGGALNAPDLFEHMLGMAVSGVDDQAVDPRLHQQLGAREAFVADRRRRRDAQAAVAVLGGVGMGGRLLDVLDGDQADAASVLVDHHQLLDAVLMQQPARFVLGDALADGDHLARHQLGDRLARIVGEAHVAVGDDAEESGRLAVGAALDHRHAGNAGPSHQRQRVGERRVGEDGDRVDHHAAFEALDLAHLLRLLLGREVAVDDADAAGLRHGDGEPGFGHRVHGGRGDRQVEADRPGQPRADLDRARHDGAVARPQQYVVESQAFGNRRIFQGRHGEPFAGVRIARVMAGLPNTGGRKFLALSATVRRRAPTRRRGVGWPHLRRAQNP